VDPCRPGRLMFVRGCVRRLALGLAKHCVIYRVISYLVAASMRLANQHGARGNQKKADRASIVLGEGVGCVTMGVLI